MSILTALAPFARQTEPVWLLRFPSAHMEQKEQVWRNRDSHLNEGGGVEWDKGRWCTEQ